MKKKSWALFCSFLATGILASCTPVPVSSSPMPASEPMLSSSVVESTQSTAVSAPEPAVKNILPAFADTSAQELSEAQMISLLENPLYPNGIIVFDWLNGVGLTMNYDDSFTNDAGISYYAIGEYASLTQFREILLQVFSENYTDKHVYPYFTEGDTPIIVERDNRLYMVSGGIGNSLTPNYSKATAQASSPDAFEVMVPMVLPDDSIDSTFTFKVVKERGIWVLDTFIFFETSQAG